MISCIFTQEQCNFNDKGDKMNKTNVKKMNKIKPVYPYLIIKRHWKKIFLAGLLTFAILFPFVKKSKNVYFETSGIIKVEPVLEKTIKVNSFNSDNSILPYYEEFINTQIMKIVSDEVIKSAISKVGDGYITGFTKDAEKQSAQLFSKYGTMSIGVEPVKKTHYIKVSVKNSNGQKLDTTVNSLMDSYIEKINEENSKIYEQKLKYLEDEKAKLEESISDNTALIDGYIKATGSGDFSAGETPYSVQIRGFESAYVDIYKRRVEAEKKYNEVLQMDKKLKDKFGGAKLEEDKNDNAYYVSRKIWLLDQIEKLNKEVDGYAKENPKRIELENKVSSMFLEIKQLDKEKNETNNAIADYKMDYKVLEAYKEYQSALMEEQEIAAQLEKSRGKYTEISTKVVEAKDLEETILNNKISLEKIKERISELKSESVTLNRVFVSEYATETLFPAGSDLNKRLAILFVISFGWIIIVCFVYDILDTRIKTVDDIQNSLGIKPSWPISHYSKGSFADLSLQEPNDRVNKAIRSLTVRLDKEREKHNAKIALFTGVDDKCGITEMILNSAHIMSKNCEKVLMIEFNFENPCLQEKLGIESVSVIHEALAHESLSEIVHFDKERNIDVLFLDKTVPLDNKDITDILEKAKAEYEFIYVDAAPVLVSDVTEYLILKADIGILVVHGNRTKYRNMIHSVEILDRLELNSFGVVLNWGKAGKKSLFQNKID